jgi:hypothetical protein
MVWIGGESRGESRSERSLEDADKYRMQCIQYFSMCRYAHGNYLESLIVRIRKWSQKSMLAMKMNIVHLAMFQHPMSQNARHEKYQLFIMRARARTPNCARR